MNRIRTPLAAVSIAVAALALAACDRQDDRTAGEKLDTAIAKTEQAADRAGAEIRQESAEAKAAVERSADKAAQAVENAADSMAAKTSDAMITAAVNAELAKDADLSALKIDVDTREGRVMLQGTAPSQAARDRATTLAASVKGVASVDNRLQVRG